MSGRPLLSRYDDFILVRSLICVILNAIGLALMHAGISMSDMILACSAGLVKNTLCIDLAQVA